MDLLSPLKPILHLFGVPLLIIFPVTFVVWLLLGKPFPEMLLLPVTLLLTPSLWLGLFLAILLSRYFAAISRVSSTMGGELGPSVKALKRLDRAYRVRELLARTKLRNAVYIGYFLKFLQLRTKLPGHPLNAYRDNLEERLEHNRRVNQALFCKLCEFVTVVGTSSDTATARKALEEFIALLPERSSKPLLTEILLHTFDDGAGFLSTLTAVTYVHYATGLPVEPGARLDAALARLTFDVASYGWLANRVFEAMIYLSVDGRWSAEQMAEKVQPILDDITDGIATSGNTDEILQAKWRGRGLLREAASIRSRT